MIEPELQLGTLRTINPCSLSAGKVAVHRRSTELLL